MRKEERGLLDMANDEYFINYTKLIEVCNLKDENGFSKCGATISIDEITDFKEPKNIKQVGIMANINVFSRGGCSVVELVFNKSDGFEFKKIQNLFEKYVEDSEECKQILTLVIVPEIYDGSIYIAMSDLVYYNTTISPSELKISASFNNDATQVITDSVVDVRKLKAEVESELRLEEDRLDEEIMELEEEYNKIHNKNIYEENLMNDFSTLDLEYSEDLDSSAEESLYKRNTGNENYGKRYTVEDEDYDI